LGVETYKKYQAIENKELFKTGTANAFYLAQQQ